MAHLSNKTQKPRPKPMSDEELAVAIKESHNAMIASYADHENVGLETKYLELSDAIIDQGVEIHPERGKDSPVHYYRNEDLIMTLPWSVAV